MRPVETIKNVAYGKGVRVSTVERVVTRADDCEEIGNLYFRLSDIYRRLDMEGITEAERETLMSDRADLIAKITEYHGYLEGYDE